MTLICLIGGGAGPLISAELQLRDFNKNAALLQSGRSMPGTIKYMVIRIGWSS